MTQKESDDIGILYGFRKVILTLILYAVGIIFRIKGLIDGGQMVDLFKSITVAFFTANMGEHITSTVRTYFGSSNQAQPGVQPPNQNVGK